MGYSPLAGHDVNLAKVKKGLQKELMRNPAKTATLLALLPLAAYFIVPLVWKKDAKTGGNVALAAAIVAPTAAPFAASNFQPGIPDWRQTSQWLAQDSRLRPRRDFGERNPFAGATPPPVEESEPEAVDESVGTAAPVTPAELGLQLSATVIGPRTRLATINGRTYAERAQIRIKQMAGDDGSQPVLTMELRSVAKNFVVLEYGGGIYRLPLQRPMSGQ